MNKIILCYIISAMQLAMRITKAAKSAVRLHTDYRWCIHPMPSGWSRWRSWILVTLVQTFHGDLKLSHSSATSLIYQASCSPRHEYAHMQAAVTN